MSKTQCVYDHYAGLGSGYTGRLKIVFGHIRPSRIGFEHIPIGLLGSGLEFGHTGPLGIGSGPKTHQAMDTFTCFQYNIFTARYVCSNHLKKKEGTCDMRPAVTLDKVCIVCLYSRYPVPILLSFAKLVF